MKTTSEFEANWQVFKRCPEWEGLTKAQTEQALRTAVAKLEEKDMEPFTPAGRKDNDRKRLHLAPRYYRVLHLLANGIQPDEVNGYLGITRATAYQYLFDIFIKNAEVRTRLSEQLLLMIGAQR